MANPAPDEALTERAFGNEAAIAPGDAAAATPSARVASVTDAERAQASNILQAACAVYSSGEGVPTRFTADDPKDGVKHKLFGGCRCRASTHCNIFLIEFLLRWSGRTLAELRANGDLPSIVDPAEPNNIDIPKAAIWVKFMRGLGQTQKEYDAAWGARSNYTPLSGGAAALAAARQGKIVVAGWPGEGPKNLRAHVALVISPEVITQQTLNACVAASKSTDCNTLAELAAATAANPPVIQCGSTNGVILMSKGFGKGATIEYFQSNI